MKVYAADIYQWEDSVFLGVFSTPEKAFEALKIYYKKSGDEAEEVSKVDYVVTELEIDKEVDNPKNVSLESWEEMKEHGNIFEN